MTNEEIKMLLMNRLDKRANTTDIPPALNKTMFTPLYFKKWLNNLKNNKAKLDIARNGLWLWSSQGDTSGRLMSKTTQALKKFGIFDRNGIQFPKDRRIPLELLRGTQAYDFTDHLVDMEKDPESAKTLFNYFIEQGKANKEKLFNRPATDPAVPTLPNVDPKEVQRWGKLMVNRRDNYNSNKNA
jgi:hypothetical protein